MVEDCAIHEAARGERRQHDFQRQPMLFAEATPAHLPIKASQAAAAVGLTTAEAQAGVMRANAAKWPPTTNRYWWTQATAAYTRMNFGQRVKLCRCCQARGLVAPLTPMHVSAECPEWNALWAWVTTTLRKTGAALPAGVTRAQWLLFGHGAASGVKAVVADRG